MNLIFLGFQKQFGICVRHFYKYNQREREREPNQNNIFSQFAVRGGEMIGENSASKERIVILLRHGESEWNNENRFVRVSRYTDLD